MSESSSRHALLVKNIQLELSHGDARLFPNRVGEAWQGVASRQGDAILLHMPRRLQFGLAPGSGDTIGFKSVVITPDMVGTRVAIFCSVEAKTGSGRLHEDQKAWLALCLKAGAFAGVARNVADAQSILSKSLENTYEENPDQ